jgi:superfamily II DNA or RNA helicase
VLARPIHHTVDTGERIELTREELAALGGADLPANVLRRLDADHRNEIIVDTWLARSSEWGKTLVFAVDIEHADRLHERFLARGAEALVVHSRSTTSRHDVLEDFRAARGPCVLVSVGMLTEGVDLPDARTVFLARPTASRMLMRQMIGRVLRGSLSGGDDIAHVVDVRDQWADDVEIVASVEIPDSGPVREDAPIPGEPQHRLLPVVDELSGEPVRRMCSIAYCGPTASGSPARPACRR